jgi:hypothetical protein
VSRPSSPTYKKQVLRKILFDYRQGKQDSNKVSLYENTSSAEMYGLGLANIHNELREPTLWVPGEYANHIQKSSFWNIGESTSLLVKLSESDPPRITYCGIPSYKYYLDDAQYHEICNLIARGQFFNSDPSKPVVHVRAIIATHSSISRSDRATEQWKEVPGTYSRTIGLEMRNSESEQILEIYKRIALYNKEHEDHQHQIKVVLIKSVADVGDPDVGKPKEDNPDADDPFYRYGKQISSVLVYKFLTTYGHKISSRLKSNKSHKDKNWQSFSLNSDSCCILI